MAIALQAGLDAPAYGEESTLQAATFSIEITPPLNQPVGQGFIPVLRTREHPLLARGVLLRDARLSCVICTLDLMEVHNDSYDYLRQTIARAAGVDESKVALHCLHQHTAPAIDTAAQRLEFAATHPRRKATNEYLREMAKKIASAIQGCQGKWRAIESVGVGMAKVERVASNRRLPRQDGSIQGRGSNTKRSPQLRQLPEGRVDPWIRTVSLEGTNGPVVQMHFYASHPQSFYGDGRASYDVPGILRERLEKETGAFQLYLTGCGGDVAFGKYNDGSRAAREAITNRLVQGAKRSLAKLASRPVKPMRWSVESIAFPLRSDAAFLVPANEKILADPKATESQRRKAAIALAWIERVRSGKRIELSCLAVGRVRILHLPGEPFVQYQLAAQKMASDSFVCVAGYGDCGMGYIGGDRIYTDRGGYEQTYAFAGPCEREFTSAIRRLITDAKGTTR